MTTDERKARKDTERNDAQVAIIERSEVAPAEVPVTRLLEMAIQTGIGVEGIERLAALAEHTEKRNAAKEFADALAQFQEECPPVKKSKSADFATKAGSRVRYAYAPLDEIARTVRPILHKHGLSYAWDTVVDNGLVRVTCHLRHRNGHEETSTFACPVDSNNPALSSPQRTAVSNTFAQRQSLVGVLGLTSTDQDIDGAAGADLDPATVSAEQLIELEDMVASLPENKRDLRKTFHYLGMPTDSKLSDILAVQFKAAMNLLSQKLQSAKGTE